MTKAKRPDVWGHGEGYEHYVGRWSRRVAEVFLDWIAVPQERDWLDVGCGTGALSGQVLASRAPRSILGIDSAQGFIDHASAHVTDPRAAFRVGDAQSLPVGDGEFDAVVSGLVLNFVPDQQKAVSEFRRAVRPGGKVAVYVWDYAGQMQLMRRFWDAAAELDPAARELDEGLRFPVCQPEPLRALFEEAGLGAVETRPIDVPTVFEDFEDYWTPFLSGQGPAPGYCVSLPEAERKALRQRLRAMLSAQADGRIPLMARAWAVQGVV